MKKVIFLIGVIISILVINPAIAQSPFNYFLMISVIPGESMDDRHRNWIEALSFKEGITQSSVGARTAAGGASATRAQFAEFTITKRIDRASVLLKKYCSSGQHIKDVFLSCALKGGMQHEIYAVKLESVVVSGVKLSADSAGVLEEVTFSYGKIEWKYNIIDPKTGKLAIEVKGGWDLIKNQETR